jgi:hypothetical protein
MSKDIEARLDRSLRNQVRLPQLDRRFDRAVWARIEMEEAKSRAAAATAPTRAVRLSRWLAISNSLGIVVTLGVASYFALGSLGGIDAPALELNVAMPALADSMVERVVSALGYVLGGVALIFGLSFTSFGRRWRASIS